MSRRRYDRNFNEYGDPRYYSPRGFKGPFGLVGFIFSMVGLGLSVAFNVLGLLLSLFTGIANSGTAPRNRQFYNETPRQEPRPQPQAQPLHNEAEVKARANTPPKQNISKEQVKETFKQEREENVSDWNILLFVLTLIPVIITLAMKRLDFTGLVLLSGTFLIVVYNIIRSSVIKAKKRRKHKPEVITEEKKEETEIDRMIKEAFDKVYTIRKELYTIPKQEVKEKLESLCTMAERVIGEVRSNPESLNSVRKFFYYYLDAFVEVFEKYVKLTSFSDSSEEVQKLLLETEKSFDDMEEIFRDMCEGMLEKDMLNLKATINVLKNSNYNN